MRQEKADEEWLRWIWRFKVKLLLVVSREPRTEQGPPWQARETSQCGSHHITWCSHLQRLLVPSLREDTSF